MADDKTTTDQKTTNDRPKDVKIPRGHYSKTSHASAAAARLHSAPAYLPSWMLPTKDGSRTLPPASPRPAIGRL